MKSVTVTANRNRYNRQLLAVNDLHVGIFFERLINA